MKGFGVMETAGAGNFWKDFLNDLSAGRAAGLAAIFFISLGAAGSLAVTDLAGTPERTERNAQLIRKVASDSIGALRQEIQTVQDTVADVFGQLDGRLDQIQGLLEDQACRDLGVPATKCDLQRLRRWRGGGF